MEGLIATQGYRSALMRLVGQSSLRSCGKGPPRVDEYEGRGKRPGGTGGVGRRSLQVYTGTRISMVCNVMCSRYVGR